MKIGVDFDGLTSDCGKLRSDAAKRLYGCHSLHPNRTFKIILNISVFASF